MDLAVGLPENRPLHTFASTMKDEDLTPEDFERLLLWLDPNREEAGFKYEKIRLRLIKFFVCGGCGCDAERLADKTFNRVSGKLKGDQVSDGRNGDKTPYFLGFARNIRHEHLREPKTQEILIPVIDPGENEDSSVIEEELGCLDQCIDDLPKEKRWVVIEYYLFEKSAKIEHRRKIANQLGIDQKALRLRVHRIREQLKPCIENCLAHARVAS